MITSRSFHLTLLLCASLLLSACDGDSNREPDPNPFGANVYIFDPDSEDIQETISAIYAEQMPKQNEFDEARYAILFKPGQYELDVRVGYYTQVSGLGVSPDDVTITGAVRTQDNPATNPINEGPGALDNFWRSVENLTIVPTLGSLTVGPPSSVPNTPGGISLNQNVWAVSQAAPLRRLHIKPSPITLSPTECTNANAFSPERKRNDPLIRECPTTLRLFDVGWSSGGFMANSTVEGLVESGSQQQWFSRNTTWTQWNTENWNMVFLGSLPIPEGTWPGTPDSDGAITDGGPTPVVREKPFLFMDSRGNFFVMVPDLRRDVDGMDWTSGTPISIADFHIVKPSEGENTILVDVVTVNAALDQGKHLLFSPGVYYVNDTIRIRNDDTVVLGLGSATLVANSGMPIMTISDVDGVKVAGLTFDAGPTNSATLLEVGEAGSGNDHASNPTSLSDIFCRVGGAHPGKASSCVTINSDNVVGDNLWLWRADHGNDVGWTDNTADNGLIVNGNDVTMYGLAVEHFQKYQTVWNGESGRVYFYQSEMPYDPPSQNDWRNEGTLKGYAAYKVADSVTDHRAWGVGVYCYFRDAVIIADRAIEVPPSVEDGFTHMITFWLNGQLGSEITHIINDKGTAVTQGNRKATLPE